VEKRYQVVIVGGGPVGVGLSIALARRGVTSAVIEKRTQLSAIPKGQGLSQRTMEHFWTWGLADEIRAARTMPEDHPIGQVTIYEDLRSEFFHASPDRTVVQDFYFQTNERLPQYRTEEVLRRRLADLDEVTPYWGAAVTGVEQDADGVRVTMERDGVRETVTGDYVVGCDGAHSVVREQADIARHGTNWDELVALIVFRSRELHEWMERFPARSTYRVMHPDLEGYWMFFGRVDVGQEFFFHAPVPAGTTPENFDPVALLHRAAGFPFEVAVDHVGFWDLRVQVADRYRAGRALIAGDAAHTHPPYGGFGLNNGLEDAVNLAWKLAAVLQGWGGEDLLESYSLERQAIFRDVGEDIIGGWIASDRDFLEKYTPEADRAIFEREWHEVTKEYGKRLRDFEPHYEGSPVVLGPPGAVISAHGEHTFAARPGHHLPPRTLASGRNAFEALGRDFTLLALDAPDGATDGVEAAAAELGVPLTVVRDGAGQAASYGAALVLVRPDQFVAWTGDEAPEDAAALLRQVTGRR
jgi:4-hydroxyisophthalate hydroxylase